MTSRPDFDDIVGGNVAPGERDRLWRAHNLLIEAGPPPELSPELDAVPWPDDALEPLVGRRRSKGRRPLLLAAAIATAIVAGFLLGQATSSTNSGSSIGSREVVQLHGTPLAHQALATLKLGKADAAGNQPMLLHVSGLPKLAKGGYYALFLTRHGHPVVSCGTINVSGATSVRMSAAYALGAFDKNGWVIVRQTPANHWQPNQVVLRAA